MRKNVVSSAELREESATEQPSWLDLSALARVAVTSEAKDHPIESAFGKGAGWRAAGPGRQTFSLIFDRAHLIKRIHLCFEETRSCEARNSL